MDQWLETSSGNRIHKSCKIKGLNRIALAGQVTVCEDCHINAGDHSIKVGKRCYFEPQVCIDSTNGDVKIGTLTRIGYGTQVDSNCNIGNRVSIGKGCKLGTGSIIRDCCVIEDQVEVPIGFLIPPFTRVSKENDKLKLKELAASYRKINETQLRILEVVGASDT
ncbi:hypothetical protein OGAPHI_004246 [Ogataea philodendri]|uniref:Dynactin subunit 5 n=1 Tax=Ogataea philodendri TaxID=1378263 RepID=A0A9P8P763_9ASCO|nr:uncharacterized protein OGAPHI_004246 [Ogataea philodendri]KAH3666057.1 hypothetical protein OGAPHI_004246 [Ogataea philodendri]